ncbi:unnamed protein product [Brachionus calyciflorus]|uniref:Sulfotransferase domain-containing protein n=1 Tax=Brachionus calyciflorus TaxID=104777 RepID=A0A813N2B4_9BILA|nr:unnamed protein product [Brachionus calyciflorus]
MLAKIILITLLQITLALNDFKIQRKRLPDAILIGAKKSGTRALLTFISTHPNVSAADSEIHFFDKYYHLGLDWYKSQMPYSNDNQIVIEKTPKYLVDPKVPQRVFQMNKNIKLIVILRNPVTRAISEFVQSQHRQKRNINNVNEQSKRFVRMLYESKNQNFTIRKNWNIIKNGLYVNHIKNWMEYFPLESFVFINGDNLIQNPHDELEKLQKFLGLKPIIKKENFVLTNQKKGFPCIRLDSQNEEVKCLSDQKGRQHPKIPDNVIKQLQDFYRPYNNELFELIKQEPFWTV